MCFLSLNIYKFVIESEWQNDEINSSMDHEFGHFNLILPICHLPTILLIIVYPSLIFLLLSQGDMMQ